MLKSKIITFFYTFILISPSVYAYNPKALEGDVESLYKTENLEVRGLNDTFSMERLQCQLIIGSQERKSANVIYTVTPDKKIEVWAYSPLKDTIKSESDLFKVSGFKLKFDDKNVHSYGNETKNSKTTTFNVPLNDFSIVVDSLHDAQTIIVRTFLSNRFMKDSMTNKYTIKHGKEASTMLLNCLIPLTSKD